MSLFRPSLAATLVAAAFASFPAAAQTVTSRVTGSIFQNAVLLSSHDSATDGNPIHGSEYTGGLFFAPSFYYGDLDTGTTNLRMLAGKDRTVSSALEFTATVTNDSDAAIDLTFAFFIGRGRVGVDHMNHGQDYTGNAALNASITWGGAPLWSVYLAMDRSGTTDGEGNYGESSTPNVMVSSAASDIQYSVSSDSIHYSPYAGSLDLGLLGAHESRTLVYRIEGEGYYTTAGEGDMYGYGGQAVVGNTDPFDFDGRPVDELGQPRPGGILTPVPEPSTYGLLGVGLAVTAAAGARRARRRRRT